MISSFAIIMLPFQFYIMTVENRIECKLLTAALLLAAYLLAINFFVLLIAFAGLSTVHTTATSESLCAVASSAQVLGSVRHGRLRRRPVDGAGMFILACVALYRWRSAVDHDLQRSHHSDLRTPPDQVQTRRHQRLVGDHPQNPPRLDLYRPVHRLPLLSREHDQHAAGFDQPDIIRGDRPIRRCLSLAS